MTGRRMTNKTIRRLIDRIAKQEDKNYRRVQTLFMALSDDAKELVTEQSRSQVLTNGDRLRHYIQGREDQYAYYGFLSALKLVLGEEVSPKMLARMYEMDEPDASVEDA